MSDQSKRRPMPETPKRGEAAWKAHKEAVASRNVQAHKSGSERRQAQDERRAVESRAAEMRERAEVAKIKH
jgi:transcription elongation GreA/GreB family factor